MIYSVLWTGLGTGALYGLTALGYFLFFRATTAVNFAIGAYVMFAGMAMAHLTSEGTNHWSLGIGIALASAIVLVWVAESLVLRPIMARSKDDFGAVVAIVALMFVIEQLAGILFGKRPVAGLPAFDSVFTMDGAVIESRLVWSLGLAIVLFAAVSAWLKYGRYGRMLRAVGDNETAARLLGLPIRRIKFAAVLVTGLVCGFSGVLQVSQAPLNFHSHLGFAITGFIAFVIGGSAGAWAGLAGGLVLGLIEALSVWYLGGGARDYVLLALVLIVFSVRPEGLFSVKVRT